MTGSEQAIVFRVVLADDHPVLRQGIRTLLRSAEDIEVIGDAKDATTARSVVAELEPDVLVLDLKMPGSGADFVRELSETCPDTRIVVYTMHGDPARAEQLLDAGAAGFVVKDSPARELLEAVRVVGRGGRYLDGQLEANAPASLATLSKRERQVLRLVAEGHTNREIAEQISVSVKSVETYRSRVFSKLGLASRADLVRFALEHGLLG